jgi:hypothetical protein
VRDGLLSGLRKVVEKTAAEFDPALLSGVTATQAVEHWAAIEKVACAQKLRAAARAEEVGIDAEGVVADAEGGVRERFSVGDAGRSDRRCRRREPGCGG